MDQFFNTLKGFIPIDESKLGKLFNGSNYKYGGFRFAAFAKKFLCEKVGLPDSIWFEPLINRDGNVVNNGINCSTKGQLRLPMSPIPRPDFVISPSKPFDFGNQRRHSKAWLIGELKLSTQGIVRSYIRPKKQPGQLQAILQYARKHTIPRVFVIGTLLNNPKHKDLIEKKLRAEAISHGIVGLVESVQD